jgi:hypothetical protein
LLVVGSEARQTGTAPAFAVAANNQEPATNNQILNASNQKPATSPIIDPSRNESTPP